MATYHVSANVQRKASDNPFEDYSRREHLCMYVCFCVAERQQLPAVPAGAGAAHRVPAHLQRALPARAQAHAHRPQAGEHPVCRLGLRGRLRLL